MKVRVWIRYALLAMTLVTVWGNRFGWAQEGPGPADELPPGAPPEMVDVSENQLPPDPCDAKDIETASSGNSVRVRSGNSVRSRKESQV
ncbi:MAG: hypothetical protein HUU55_24195 [Myxococcales bacterium]|nr:hypothetical protein [Myxococcales bacterium]